MVERREDLSFTVEPRKSIRIERQKLRQCFERDIAPQLRVVGAIDLAHPTRSDRLEHLVDADAEPRQACLGPKDRSRRFNSRPIQEARKTFVLREQYVELPP